MSAPRPRRRPRLSPRAALVACAALAACGAAPAPPPHTLPDDAEARDEAVMALGASLWGSLRRGDALALLVPDDGLGELVDGSASTRIRLRRPGVSARLGETVRQIPAQLEGATYLGVCAQDARDEPAGGALGLLEPTWVIGRVLVAGRIDGSSRRIALWVDGPFVFDGARFVALDVSAVESPRWEHSDLEIGACDVSEGL